MIEQPTHTERGVSPDPIHAMRMVLGGWLVRYAENVEDMGHRVADVLERDPLDHHYAGSKLHYALTESVKALAIADYKLEDLLADVEEAHESGIRDRQDLSREFRGSGA
ncbi:hypothetical protein [Conexibacter sp. DBS9H8]|uniref:hypothetical protein n=1 Tax=Conexibacter sp. DBS9H8 TaxID=2937801 RepID=UPI00200D2126|nr:hypothetical protein [Conexibacter sp. DBS9H8]